MKRKILVVEDNDVNLELVQLLIEQYCKEHGTEIDVLTAMNGQSAVDLCEGQKIDLVFMDIMMPKMNGSEATKIIKMNHPHTMVIVISTLGDEAKQKEMLRMGAEDYLVKPINAPLFKSRLHNYLQLIEYRNHISRHPRAKNLFTTKVFNYHMEFRVVNEAGLSEFWEAMLIRLDFQRHIDHLSDFVRFVYRIATLQIRQNFQFHIYVEEDTSSFYFTLDNMQLIGCERLERMINNHCPNGIYLCKKGRLSFILPKSEFVVTDIEASEAVEAAVKPDQPKDYEAVTRKAPHMDDTFNKHVVQPTPEVLQTYTILDEEELEEFEANLTHLRSLMLMMENSSLESDDIEQICHCFETLASITAMSNDTYVISSALKSLAAAITENDAAFEEHADQLFAFINAFVNDLIFWKEKIFYEGASSIDFLNDSITTNANMFTALLAPQELPDDAGIDDIFDF
jgi:CheY-like chemotaxis protein